ncbi:MAG: Ldh family oxidoreductase [Haloarculaceae archaeon]
MHLSVREVLQLSERCFAAAGFSEGTARSHAESIWWTEAYKGSGFTTLHDHLDVLEDFDATALSLREQGSRTALIDGDGQPGLVASTPALDFACSKADQHGLGVAAATTADDDGLRPTLGHVAYAAAERGYVGVVLVADGAGGSTTVVATPDEPHPFVAELALDAPSGGLVDLLDVFDAGLHRRRDDPLAQAVFRRDEADQYPTAQKRLLNRLLQRATEPDEDPRIDVPPGFVTLCVDPTTPPYADGVRQLVERFVDDHEEAFTHVYRPREIHDHAETLLHEGVDVEEDRWRDVFEYSSRVLAPEFEGSYRGAGFNINE